MYKKRRKFVKKRIQIRRFSLGTLVPFSRCTKVPSTDDEDDDTTGKEREKVSSIIVKRESGEGDGTCRQANTLRWQKKLELKVRKNCSLMAF